MLDYLLLTIYISEKILKSPGQKTHANQFHEFFLIIKTYYYNLDGGLLVRPGSSLSNLNIPSEQNSRMISPAINGMVQFRNWDLSFG